MAKTSVGGRPGGGTARQRSGVAAAVRAATKRSQKARSGGDGDEAAGVVSGRTVVVPGEESAESATAPVEPDEEAPDASGADDRDASAADTAEGKKPARDSAGKPAGKSAGKTTEKPDEKGRTRLRLPASPAVLRDRPGLVRAVLVGVTVVAVAATVLLGLEVRESERTQQARTEAVSVAQKAAPEILSYDHRHLEQDFKTARSHLTGSFREKFNKTTVSVVTPTAKKYDGVVKATVAKPPAGDSPAVSVVSASPDEVVVLLFMNQVTESAKVSEPRIDMNRVRMTLTDTENGWKVSALDAL